MGAALVSLRYVMGAPNGTYKYNQADLNYALRRAMDKEQVDAPGTRDLRWANSHTTTPRDLALGDFFSLNPAHIGSNTEKKYNLQNGTEIYNENLKLLNTNDRYRLSSKYHALFGVTSKKAKVIDGYWGLWPKFENFEGTHLGALIMWWIMDDGDQSYLGHKVRDSDGAVPIVSASGAGIMGGHGDLGDMDHEEYFNNLSDARKTVHWTLGAFNMEICCAEGEVIIEGECVKQEFNYPSADWIHKASLDDLINKFCPRPNVTGQIKHVTWPDGQEAYIDYAINHRIGPDISPDGNYIHLVCWDGHRFPTDSFDMSSSRGVYGERHYTKDNSGDSKIKNGPERSWYSNGNLKKEYNYKDGKLDGSWKEWCENGFEDNIKNYKNDKLDGEQFNYVYGCKGILAEKNSYNDGLKDGVEYRYDLTTGALKMEVSYKDDLVHGTVTKYYSNHAVDFTCEYNKGSCVKEVDKFGQQYCPCGWFSK
jgi:hypothetical protein